MKQWRFPFVDTGCLQLLRPGRNVGGWRLIQQSHSIERIRLALSVAPDATACYCGCFILAYLYC